MPLSPSAAQSAASRANGAASHGPTTPEGKARSSRNGMSHGLTTRTFAILPGEDPAEHTALLAGYLARYAPLDEAERLWVEQMVFAAWRLRRLEAVEADALAASRQARTPDGEAEPAGAAAPPSLATLARYRGRIERDHRFAEARLEAMQARRPAQPAGLTRACAPQLRWAADMLERRAEERGIAEPEPDREAIVAANEDATLTLPPGTDEFGAAAAAPEPRAPNRAARRRMAALARARGAAPRRE